MGEPVELGVLVLVDNGEPIGSYKSSYGYSLYLQVRYDDGSLKSFMFDTGESWSTLNHNLKLSNIDCSFRKVVISHWHRDHYGGLRGLAENCGNLKVYVPTRWKLCRELEKLGVDVIECRGRNQIYEGVWVLGPISGSEELVAKTRIKDLGTILITGCGHAGIFNIFRWALGADENLYSLLGGLHIKWKDGETTSKVADALKERGIREYYPLHHRFKRATRFRRELRGIIKELKVGEWKFFNPHT